MTMFSGASWALLCLCRREFFQLLCWAWLPLSETLLSLQFVSWWRKHISKPLRVIAVGMPTFYFNMPSTTCWSYGGVKASLCVPAWQACHSEYCTIKEGDVLVQVRRRWEDGWILRRHWARPRAALFIRPLQRKAIANRFPLILV